MKLSDLKPEDKIHLAFKSDTVTVIAAPNGGKAIAIAHIEATFIGWENCPVLGVKVLRCAMETGSGNRNEWTFPIKDVFIGAPGMIKVASPVVLS
jgi:hypothetical protein|tara:strand:- start:6210 stop:6494 length:285 start_codon:yes stop_codon:yes gene_type:complete